MARMHDDVDKENDPSSSSLLGKSLPNLESGTKAESNFPLHCLTNLLPSALHPPRVEVEGEEGEEELCATIETLGWVGVWHVKRL
uniref:Uncharacterized protein n=1 Tax=Echinococcus granulosus TaxID=6210 RepID=A0A068WQU5_ECHGR|nr:hypothetical protein EgrG_000220000 [Echinococcus granulosus]